MKRTDEKLETLLKAWGLLYPEEPRVEDYQRRSRQSHPIATSMEFAPGKKVTRSTEYVRRAGFDRRRIMGRAAGIAIVGAAFVDPVRCKASKEQGYGHRERPVPREIERVEHAVRALEEAAPVRGLCVRAKFCTGEGSDADKAAAATERMREQLGKYHPGVSVAQFRDHLTAARLWLAGRLSVGDEQAA